MTSAPYIPEAGDLIWLNLDPRTGHEQSGHRPVLVVSPKKLAQRVGLAIVCPITSNIKGLPGEVILTGTKTKGVIMPIHVRIVDTHARSAVFIEAVPQVILIKVRKRLGLFLGL